MVNGDHNLPSTLSCIHRVNSRSSSADVLGVYTLRSSLQVGHARSQSDKQTRPTPSQVIETFFVFTPIPEARRSTMHHPCSNLACSAAIASSVPKARRETGLCWRCRRRWQIKGVPTGGYIPNGALRVPHGYKLHRNVMRFCWGASGFPYLFTIILKPPYLG